MKLNLPMLVIMAILVVNEAHPQLIKSYGLKAGITSADQTFDWSSIPDPSTERRVGFCLAAYAEWLNLPAFSVVTQLEYNQRGVGEKLYVLRFGPSGSRITDTQVFYSRLDYLSIPILAKTEIPLGNVRPFIAIGPRLDFLLGYQTTESKLLYNTFYDDFRGLVLGGSVSIGIVMEGLFPFAITFEGRYNHDFSYSQSNQLIKIKNNAFDFWLGVGL